MDSQKIDYIIEYLGEIKKRPQMYLGEPFNLNTLGAFLNGMRVAFKIFDYIQDQDIIKDETEKHGFEFSARSTLNEMEESGLAIEEIVVKMMELEISIWQSLKDRYQ